MSIQRIVRAIVETFRFEWRMQMALHRMESYRATPTTQTRATPSPAQDSTSAHAAPRAADCPLANCQTCRPDPLLTVSSLSPAEVGRQAVEGDAIKDVVRWLECSGWYGEDQGALQCYATWLLGRRAAYERGAEVTS